MAPLDLTLAALDWLGILVFAATGALVASRKQMDVVGFVLFGTVTGIGGGTVRDLVLDAHPLLWVEQPAYLGVCAAVSVLVFFGAHRLQSRYGLLLWLDALGLALFAVAGAEKGLIFGVHPIVAVALGVVTATFGGVIRDVLGGEPSVILRPEIYVTAAFVGATLFVLLTTAGLPRDVSVLAGVAAGFAVRGGALRYGWTLPRYRPRPGRDV